MEVIYIDYKGYIVIYDAGDMRVYYKNKLIRKERLEHGNSKKQKTNYDYGIK